MTNQEFLDKLAAAYTRVNLEKVSFVSEEVRHEG